VGAPFRELTTLYFGRDDAEMDIADGGLLREGFLRTAAFEAALSGRKHLIIGRKGSGKSAICRTLAALNNGAIAASLITPDDISADEVRRFDLQGITAEKAKELLWRYIFLVAIGQRLVGAHENARQLKLNSVEAVRKFLVANEILDELRLSERFWQAIRGLKTSFSLEAFGVKISANTEWPSEGIRAASQLEIIEKNVNKALIDIGRQMTDCRLLVLVDQVDDIWTDDVQSHQMVVGLLRAGRLLSSTLPGVSCVIFLRRDIYDTVQFFDKDKFHGDEMRVDWTAERLLQLAVARASASLRSDVTAERLWEYVFPSTISGEQSTSFIVEHTLMRPRDLIHLCNLCRDTAVQNGHDTIAESDVSEAITQYSQWKLQDLIIEYRIAYPFLSGLLAILEGSGYIILREGLDRRLAEVRDTLQTRYHEYADAFTLQAAIDVLFEVGVIGVRRGSEIVYGYSQHSLSNPQDTEFTLHPCFRSALRAVTASVRDHYQPANLIQRTRRAFRGEFVGTSARTSYEYLLIERLRDACRDILVDLNHSELPPEVRAELSAEVGRILAITEDVANAYSSGTSVDILSHTYRAAQFLEGLAEQLEHDGYDARQETRFLVRSIQERAAGLEDFAGGGYETG
jgi:hypothetical protein